MAPTTKSSRSSVDDDKSGGGQQVPFRRAQRARKYKSIVGIMKRAKRVELEFHDDGFDQMEEDENGDDDEEFGELGCEECGLGDKEDEILICDKCDKGYHMLCLRPIMVRVPIGPWYCPSCSDHIRPRPHIRRFSQTKIIDFFQIQKCGEPVVTFPPALDAKKRRKRSLVLHKKKRRFLPFLPEPDTTRRLLQMKSLASALTTMNMEFSSELNYVPGMAPRSANQATLEIGGMQVLSKEDVETFEYCKAMEKSGLYAPLMVVYDSCEGYTVEADGPIKDMTLISEYVGDVDYSWKRDLDDCDGLMTLLSAKDPSKSLVICPDKRGNIARFISGINNHLPESKKKQNLKCVRYNVYGESRVLLIAIRDIAKGERLYYDYNGCDQDYPTHHFI